MNGAYRNQPTKGAFRGESWGDLAKLMRLVPLTAPKRPVHIAPTHPLAIFGDRSLSKLRALAVLVPLHPDIDSLCYLSLALISPLGKHSPCVRATSNTSHRNQTRLPLSSDARRPHARVCLPKSAFRKRR